jgi:hypothetical protein
VSGGQYAIALGACFNQDMRPNRQRPLNPSFTHKLYGNIADDRFCSAQYLNLASESNTRLQVTI